MTSRRSGQTAIFATGLAAMVLLQGLLDLGPWGQVLVLAPAVALLGLPHGALDLPMAETLWPFRGARDRAVFFAAYLGLAGAVGLLWWLAPTVALAAFLGYSALHFSGDWRGDGRLWQVAGGVSAIGAPALFHPAEVAAIFAVLDPTAWADAITHATAAAGLAGAGCAIAAMLSAGRWPPRHPVAELATIWIGAALLPPLLYFVVYFCLLHSLRHLTATLDALPDRRRARRGAAGIMAVSLAGAGVTMALLTRGAGGDVAASLTQLVFMGLAALTVPHMILVDRFAGRRVAFDPSAE